jgi:hypothetical protein
MSVKNGVLNLVLTYEWYDKIESGEKTIEYRENTEHWLRAFYFRRGVYKTVRFQRGYKNPKTMEFQIKNIKMVLTPNSVKKTIKTKSAWAIKIGDRIK